MRKKRRFGIIPIIIIFALFGDFIPLAGVLAVTVLPLLVVGLTIAFFIKAITGNKDKEENTTSKGNVRSGNSTVKKVSPHDFTKINAKLQKYFKNHLSLKLVDDVALSPAKGNYTNVNELYLTLADEKVVQMAEFRMTNNHEYEGILTLLEKFALEEVEEKKSETIRYSKAEEYIAKINELNDAIPHAEISNGLDQTCALLKQIDLAREKSGKDDSKLKKLNDYYLPILLNILEKYKSLQNTPQNDEYRTCETQLIKTVTLINEALKNIGSSLFENDFMDLNADISTLQSLLKKDGLVENPFEEKGA